MSPYIATISFFLPPAGGSKKTPTPERGDIQIAYQFAFQNGRWEFVKGTWTAYHYDGTVNVSSKADQKEINSLSELLNK